MSTNGFLARKLQGQVPVSNAASSHNTTPKPQEKTKKKSKNSRGQKQTPTKDERATVKIPQNIKQELNIVKQTEQFNYDYEVIQYLVDVYIEHLSPEDRKRFNILKDYL